VAVASGARKLYLLTTPTSSGPTAVSARTDSDSDSDDGVVVDAVVLSTAAGKVIADALLDTLNQLPQRLQTADTLSPAALSELVAEAWALVSCVSAVDLPLSSVVPALHSVFRCCETLSSAVSHALSVVVSCTLSALCELWSANAGAVEFTEMATTDCCSSVLRWLVGRLYRDCAVVPEVAVRAGKHKDSKATPSREKRLKSASGAPIDATAAAKSGAPLW
jgi:hypothetical protein